MSRSFLPRAVQNSVFSGLGTLSTFVLGFLFAGLTIRYLGEARAGYLLTLQATIGLNTLLGGFGLGTPSIRRVATLHAQGDPSTAGVVVGSVSTVNIATGLFFASLIMLAFPSIFTISKLDVGFRSECLAATAFLVGSFVFSQAASSWQAVYQATQRYDLVTALSTVFGLLSGVSGLVVLQLAPSLSVIAASSFAVAFMRLICDAYFVRRLLGRIPLPTWRWSEIRPMLGLGGWSYATKLGAFLFTNLDRLILTTFLGSAAMPYYVIPQRLYSQIHTSIGSQYQFLFPMLSALGDGTAAQLERLDDRLRWFVALTSGVAYGGLALVGPAILSRLVSPEFAKVATIPLALACVQGLFHAQNIVPYLGSWAIGAGAPNATTQLLHGILVGITAVVLIPRFGVIGASMAQLWIVPLVIVLNIWVQRLVSPHDGWWRWLRAYLSPSLMLGVCFSIVAIGRQFIPLGAVSLGLLACIGLALGIASVWVIERFVFPAEDRWPTLMRALGILVNGVWRRFVFARQRQVT